MQTASADVSPFAVLPVPPSSQAYDASSVHAPLGTLAPLSSTTRTFLHSKLVYRHHRCRGTLPSRASSLNLD